MPSEEIIQEALVQEILDYYGLAKSDPRRALISPFLRLPASRLARIACEFDRQVGESGFCQASRWLLPRVFSGHRVLGRENIPSDGPLIIAANHPGSYDTFLTAACLPRNDIKVIARDMPLLRMLDSTNPYLIYSSRDPHVKMTAAKAAIRHLRGGGVLLVYPTGTWDPDPACMPGAELAVERWSASLELLLRYVPEARLQVSISSGFLDRKYLYNPLAILQKDNRWVQIVAEILQISEQLMFNKKHHLIPLVTFGEPQHVNELTRNGYLSPMEGAIEAGQRCLAAHLQILSLVTSEKLNWRAQLRFTEYS
jgi:hypothetical protein